MFVSSSADEIIEVPIHPKSARGKDHVHVAAPTRSSKSPSIPSPPEAKTMFMSRCADEILDDHGTTTVCCRLKLSQKAFTPKSLAAAVRAALDGPLTTNPLIFLLCNLRAHHLR
jgi:hypothetical protein